MRTYLRECVLFFVLFDRKNGKNFVFILWGKKIFVHLHRIAILVKESCPRAGKNESSLFGNNIIKLRTIMKVFTKYLLTLLLLSMASVMNAADPLFADGTYYLYNIGTGKYLAAGANWGTHAVVNADGLDFILTSIDGKYTIDSQVSNGGNSHYLNGEWTDGAAFGWTFSQVRDGIYTISDGTNYLAVGADDQVVLANDSAMMNLWQLKTLEDRIAELAAATAEAPVDATFLIPDANFGRNDLRRGAWSIEASNWNLSGGNNLNNCAESYHSPFKLSQTLYNAPAGKYEMTAQGFYRQDAGQEAVPMFFANDKTASFPLKTGEENSMSTASVSFTAGLYTIDPIKVTTFEPGQLTIGAQGTASSNWVVWDNFRLMYYGNQIDLTELVNAYSEALGSAQKLLRDSIYSHVTGMERTELAQVINDYSAVDQSDESVLIGATTALERASGAFISAVAGYDAFANAKANVNLAAYPYASQEIRSELNSLLLNEPNDANEATYYAEEVVNKYRMYAYSHSLLEGESGVESMIESIYNPMASEYTDGWETVFGEDSGGNITVLGNERPNYGYDEVYNYFDGGNWSASAWDVTFQQNISLPAGKYMLTVMSRASQELVNFRLFAGDNSTEMTHIGAQGGLYGRGWNDASIIFELTEETELPIGVQGVTVTLHNWMSFTNFRLMKFSSEQNNDPVDMTAYILNAGFDEDLTWQADGSKKTIIDQSIVLSNRSIAAIAADSTVYATVNPEISNRRPDGRTYDATNGFIGRIKGWTIETNQEYPKCEWVYFGSLPYALEGEAIPIADDGNSYITVPAKPEAAAGDDNVGFVYMRAGWNNRAVYKQTVELPCATYRLEYWSINLNPSGTNGKNLSKITCRNDVWLDETGFSSAEWTKHEIEFTPTAEFTMEFGFESSGGSASNPFLCIDGIKLYKIGEADQEVLQRQDLEVIIAQIEDQIGIVGEAGLAGVVSELEGAAAVALEAYDNYDLTAEEMEQTLKNCRTTLEQSAMALAQVNSITSMIEKMERVAETTDYPGKQTFEQSISQMSESLWSGTSEQILPLYRFGKEALLAYYQSQQATADSPADYTYLITHPWFIDEAAEPYSDGNGGYTFPNGDSYIEGGSNSTNTDLTMEGWVWWRGGSMSGWDLRTNWVQGRSCFNAWYRSADYAWAAIVQDLTNVPEGYYTLSAEMMTQEGCVTDQHIFATNTSYNVDRFAESYDSPSLTIGGWSEDGNPVWTTLTTPVFYVGPDGLLTIGARGNHPAATDSLYNYTSEGWFLATNFRLNYYGLTEPQVSVYANGDVNHDEAVDVTDAVLIIDEILMKSPQNFDAALADVNHDTFIDVTDVVMVIDKILGKIELSRGATRAEKDLTAYTAFQMDLTIPAGYVLEGVELTEMAKDSHKLAYSKLDDGRCRVVVFSMDNEALPGAWDEVIRLNLKGQGDATVNVDRAMVVTVGGERHELLINGTTSIAQFSTLNSQFSIVYDLTGRKVQKTAKGVYIENGRKVVK